MSEATVTQLKWQPRLELKARLRLVRKDYGERIGRKKLTQEEFAAIIDVNPATYGSWEAGNSKPADLIDTARHIEKVTGADATWLLGLTDSGPEQDGPRYTWIPETAGQEPLPFLALTG